jgi:prepilin-type processing-associated H-X9-DG protein
MHVMPINARNCHLYGGEDDGTNLVTASSRHASGANVLYADGHVGFVTQDVDREIWWAIGSRNGSEVISER